MATEQGIDLPHRKVDPPLAQLLVQQGLRHLALMVSVEHEAPHFGAKGVPIQVRWQTPRQPLPPAGFARHPDGNVYCGW